MHPCPAHRVVPARKTWARRSFEVDPRVDAAEAGGLNLLGKDLDRALNVLPVGFRPAMIQTHFPATEPVSITYQAQPVVPIGVCSNADQSSIALNFFRFASGCDHPPRVSA